MCYRNKSEIRLEIGDIVIGLICPTEEYAESMKDYFRIENSMKSPDIQLILNIIPHENSINIPDSLFKNKIVEVPTDVIKEYKVDVSPDLILERDEKMAPDGSKRVHFKLKYGASIDMALDSDGKLLSFRNNGIKAKLFPTLK